MRRQDQIVEARKLLDHLDNRSTALADAIYRNPVAGYTCETQAAAERDLFFRKGVFTVGLSALLPNPGDWMTHDYSGVPIVLARGRDGKLGAFLNVCRHRRVSGILCKWEPWDTLSGRGDHGYDATD